VEFFKCAAKFEDTLESILKQYDFGLFPNKCAESFKRLRTPVLTYCFSLSFSGLILNNFFDYSNLIIASSLIKTGVGKLRQIRPASFFDTIAFYFMLK
jgi:hypothetical protein